jgi:hypothetical protein
VGFWPSRATRLQRVRRAETSSTGILSERAKTECYCREFRGGAQLGGGEAYSASNDIVPDDALGFILIKGLEQLGVLLLAALDGKTVLASVLRKKEEAEQCVEQFIEHKGKGLADDPFLKTTADLLPDKLQLVGYVNVKEIAMKMVVSPAAPAFPDAPPLAYALRVFDSGAEAQFLLPFEVVKAFFAMGKEDRSKKEK